MSGIRCQERDAFHLQWLQFPFLEIFSREGLDKAFKQLSDNNEIKQTTNLKVSRPTASLSHSLFVHLPDFERGQLGEAEFSQFLKHFQKRIESSAMSLFTDSPCTIVLQQRVAVLSRLCRAIAATQKMYVRREEQLKGAGSAILPCVQDTNKALCSTTDMLIETGVRAGLQLFFSLLKQQLQTQLTHPQIDTQLCTEVLTSLRDTLSQFPPTFLSSNHSIPSLGLSCISDVDKFLQQLVFNNSPIDTCCRCLAAETHLTLMIGKTSLIQLLEYFSKVLRVKSGTAESGNVSDTTPYVSRDHIQKILNEMYQTKAESADDTTTQPIRAEGDHVTLYKATFLLFKQLLFLADTRLASFTLSSVGGTSVCEVFGFGSNGSGQLGLGSGSVDRCPKPIKLENMSNCSYVCAGQNCTLVVYPDGCYKACGKGSYGRLGTGSSNNCASLTRVEIKGVSFTCIASAKGSDGHSLGLTSDGLVYSWGEGDSGRLGHGNSISYQTPKLIQGPFFGKIIKSISVGSKHSAAVSITGELFTWGDGDSGKLGINNINTHGAPTLVSAISGVVQVSCGSSHTLALSHEGTVWSWGSGEGGKLGHGGVAKQTAPKEIINLRERDICKVQAGSHVSIALSTDGKVFSWGNGPALGLWETDTPCLVPTEINTLKNEFVIDVSVGDTHCLALTRKHDVFAWGSNNNAQCGLGHQEPRVSFPTKIHKPESADIFQISAGLNHSIIWTAIPTEMSDSLKNWPYCLDMTENTFRLLREFLEKYCTGFETHKPFDSIEDNNEFVVYCLNLLKIHLRCVVLFSNPQDSIGQEIIPLGQLLFKLMDSSTPLPIQNAVNDTLELGATLLIPPLPERLHYIWYLIPKDSSQWTQLTKGQVIQLQVMLESLGNEQTVIGLLVPLISDTVAQDGDTIGVDDKNRTLLQLVEIMMKYILAFMDRKIEETKSQTAAGGTDGSDTLTTQMNLGFSPKIISLFKHFLILLYKHIFANFALKTECTEGQINFLRQHLDTIIPGCLECLEKIKLLALTNPENLNIINELNFPNAIIPLVTHGLLLFPLQQLIYLTEPVTELCLQLSRTTEAIPNLSFLCESQESEWKIGELDEPLLASPLTFPLSAELASDWCWLVDTHRCGAFLLGLLLNLQLTSLPVETQEESVAEWSYSVLLANGMQDNYREGIMQWKQSANEIACQLPFSAEEVAESVMKYETVVPSFGIPETDPVAQLILDLAHARIEINPTCSEAYTQLIQFATVREWDTSGDDDIPGLREVSCGMLAAVAKHCRISILTPLHGSKTSVELSETYEGIFRVRRELFSLRPLEATSDDTNVTQSGSETEYSQLCATIRALCLFLIQVVSPATKEVSDGTASSISQGRKQIISPKTLSSIQPSKPPLETSNSQSEKDSPLDSIAEYFQRKDTFKSSESTHTPTLSSSIIRAITQFLLEPIEAYKAKHFKEQLTSPSVLVEPVKSGNGRNETLLRDIAFTMTIHKKRAEMRLEALKLIQALLLSRGSKPIGQISSILPTAYRLLQTSLLGNSGICENNNRSFVIMSDVTSAPRDLQIKIRSAFNKILSYVFKQIAQAAKACTKAVEMEKVPLYLDLVINMSWLQGKVQSFDVNEVCSAQILSVLAELSGIVSTKLPLPFPVDNTLERCVRNIAAMLFYYITAVVGYNAEDLNPSVLESVVGLLYGELEGQFIPYKPKILCRIPTADANKQRRFESQSADNTNDLQIQTPVDFFDLSLPFEFNRPVHPETLKQLEKLWATISSEDREYSMGSYINYLTRVVSTAKMKAHFANTDWVGLLLRIAGVDPDNCLPRCVSIRTRMLALNLLSNILTEHPRENASVKKKIIDVIFNQMSLCQFGQPVFHIKKQKADATTKSGNRTAQTDKHTFENMNNSVGCTIEGNLIKKTIKGDGFVFLNHKLCSEIYSWKIKLVFSDNANNSVFIGVVSVPFHDTAVKSTQASWTMDTFSGNFFHNGQLPELFTPCVSGETIQCVFNGVTKKLSFAKDSEAPVEVFQNIKSPELYPFIAFNNKSTAASVEFIGFDVNTFIPTHRDTQELITTELSHGFIPKPLSHQHICIGEGFRRLLRQLMQSENWQTIIQTCCRERFNLMDSIVQSLVNKTLTGHVEVHRLCFQIWPVLSFLANRNAVLSVGGGVFYEEENLFGVISLNNHKQPLLFFDTQEANIQSPMLLPTDKIEPIPLPKLDGFNWGQIGPITLLNLAHLSGLWDDEEMNVLTAGAPFLSRGYAKHLVASQESTDITDATSVVPIYVTASLEWRQVLMWEVQAMAARTLQTVLTQDRFCQLLTYHPISISDDTSTEDQGDLSQAVQQIMRHIVSRSISPSSLSPAVSLACLETAHGMIIRNSILKLYTDCADAILGSGKLDETELALACIPTPPPDIPKLYHPTNVPPPIPPKTRRVSPLPVPPVRTLSPVPPPAYVSQLIEMGFSEQQVTRARRKLKLNSNESIANQTSSLVMWLLEHATEDDSGGETDVPPPLPPREEPLLFPLTLEQTLAREGYPPQAPLTPPVDNTTNATQPPDRQPKSDTDRFLEGLFPDFNRTDFSVAKNLARRGGDSTKDLLEGPDPTAFIRDVYRNIPEVSGDLKDNCKNLFFKKNDGILNSEIKEAGASSDDPLGSQSVTSNRLSSEKSHVFSRRDTELLEQCSHMNTLDEYVNAMERITNAIKTQISRQLLLLACSSLSLKLDDFLYGLSNIGIQDLTLLIRLLRLSATYRFGSFSSDLDNSVCILSAIKQVLMRDRVSLGRLLQICTRDILAAAVSTTNSPDSYFLSSHSKISDSTVFATVNFQVTQLLVEAVIDVVNSPGHKDRRHDQSDPCVFGVVSLADALSACEFSEKLSSEEKQWVTEQIVKLLIIPKEYTAHATVKPELTLVEALSEVKGHSKQVMSTVWSEKTAELLSISKDNTIRVWKSASVAGSGKAMNASAILEFSSADADTVQQTPPGDTQEAIPKLIKPSVLPYIAIDHSGEYIAASRQQTVNVWYTGFVNNNNNKQTLKCTQKLDRLVTFSCFKTPFANSPTTEQPTVYIPCLLSGCIDGSIYSAEVKLDFGDEKLSLEFRELEDMRLPDNGAVVKMIWDESGHTLAVGSSKGSVTLYSQQNDSDIINRDKTLVLHENVVHSLQFNSSGNLLATLADGEAIKISGRLNGMWDNIGFIAIPNQTCFSWLHSTTPQSKDFIACGGDRGFVYICATPHWPYDLQVATQADANSLLDKQLELLVTCYSMGSDITCLAFSIDGVFVSAGHKDGSVSVWLASSGEELVYTQTNHPAVSITPAGSDRIITCHLNSPSLFSLSLTPDTLFKTRTLSYCNAKLKCYGIDSLERVPFLQAFLSQLGHMLYTKHLSEQQDIHNQKQLVHSRMHQSLASLAIGLGLDSIWTQDYLSELFPRIKLRGEFHCKNWSWISSFKQALLAVECMGRRTALPVDFPGISSLGNESDREAQMPSSFSVDMDSQLMQWSNQHPEDWILGGRAKVFFWGAGGSGQLANDSKSTSSPELCSFLECTQRIVASVNCTYAINHDGSVHSFGDGAYGKLGHNSTEAFILPQCIEALQGYIIVQISAARGGEGHCLALSHNGEVFSWGDGEFGRLGHGDATKQRKPKKIEALKGKKVVMVSAGDKYSAVVTEEGELWTFGSGSDGKTGHGISEAKRTPKQVTRFLKDGEEIRVKIGQISCGSSHSLAVSTDGNEVFSFGEGQNYKLGNGSNINVLTPQAIPLLSGIGVKKVLCGSKFSLALTEDGKLYAWGHHTECCSAIDIHTPQLLATNTAEVLASRTILDVQAGPDYAIALTSCGEVWAWGSNREGQLGLGDKDPRIQPCVIKELSGKSIRQISAGKCHAAASTAPLLSFLNLLDELGQPSCIPTKYTALSNTKMSLLRSRLKLLTQFSSTVFSQWPLFNCNSFQPSSIDVLQSWLLDKANVRPIFSQNMFRSKMLQTLTHTMIASKSYGPIITVKRIPSEGHKHKPLFYQISPQILFRPQELLLPQRAWKVTLIGEGADDAGGVFDETIALMCIELEDGTLPFLIPTPNARNKCGYNTDRFVFNPGCATRKDMGFYKFIGILFGIAIRTKKPLALHLAPLVWKLIAGIEITMDDLEEVDSAFMQAMRGIRQLSEDVTPETFSEMIPISSYEAYNMAGQLSPILTGGSNIPLTYANRKEYVDKSIHFRLHELDRQALAVREGMSLIVPVPLLSLTTGGMLEIAVCGEKELDIQVLKKVAKYRDCSANDTLIKWLWDSLENFTNEEKILFLRFTSGRSRLPARVQDVTQRLLVIKTLKNKNALPTAQTCFFQLKLPNYTSQEILAARLRYAINNCRSIDTDGYMLPRNTSWGGGSRSSDEDY